MIFKITRIKKEFYEHVDRKTDGTERQNNISS